MPQAHKTFRDFIDGMCACKTPEVASSFIDCYVDEVLAQRPELVREEARAIAMSNIGYATGYLDHAEAGRLLQLFGARHPVFGGIEDWPKTPEEAIELGMKIGNRARRSRRA